MTNNIECHMYRIGEVKQQAPPYSVHPSVGFSCFPCYVMISIGYQCIANSFSREMLQFAIQHCKLVGARRVLYKKDFILPGL